jgi:hypothetical protein
VVEINEGGKGYEVDFVAADGGTAAVLTLKPEDIRPAGAALPMQLNNGDTTIAYTEFEGVLRLVARSHQNRYQLSRASSSGSRRTHGEADPDGQREMLCEVLTELRREDIDGPCVKALCA